MKQPVDGRTNSDRTSQSRKGDRVGLSANVTIRRTGHRGYRVSILDVSLQGCRAEFVERPKLHERLWVKFDDLQSMGATVCWTRGFEVGLEFERPIHAAVFDMLITRLNG